MVTCGGSPCRQTTINHHRNAVNMHNLGRCIFLCLEKHAVLVLCDVQGFRAIYIYKLPDTQAGFRPARGCRDNVCALRWFINMVLREGRQAVVTFIDYSAAFDTESQLFLDSALAETGISSKVWRIVQAIFVRIRQQDGGVAMSEPFNIDRGVLQGDIFSPVCFIAGLDRIFRLYDHVNPGMTVGTPSVWPSLSMQMTPPS